MALDMNDFSTNQNEGAKVVSDKKLRIGIIGTGGISGSHIRTYLEQPDVEVAAGCDLITGKAEEKFAEFKIEGTKMLGKKTNELGMKMCYHNHDFEFDKIGDEYAIDVIYREVTADLLQPEFDTCWVKVTGVDPVDYIRKYAGRQEILHLKDFVGGRTENMYGLIGIDENETKDTAGKFEFRFG